MNESNQNKGLRMMDLIGDLPDDLVLSGKPETDPHAGEEKQENWFLRMMSSPAVAVALSLCVAFGVLFLIVRAGRGAGGRQTAGQMQVDGANVSVSGSMVLPDGKITQISISTEPRGYFGELTDTADIQTVVDCLLNMSVKKLKDGTFPTDKTGMVWVITFTYDDGYQYETFEFDKVFGEMHGLNRFRISEKDEKKLDELLRGYVDRHEAEAFRQPIPENPLLPEGTVTAIDVYSMPEDPDNFRTLTMGGDIDLLLKRLLDMDLTSVEGDDVGAADLIWAMIFTYEEGGKPYEIYEAGQILLVLHDDEVRGRYSISQEDEAVLDALLRYFIDNKAPEETESAPTGKTETEPGSTNPGENWAESMELSTDVIDTVGNLTVTEYSAIIRIQEGGEFIDGEWVNKNPDLPGPRITSDEDWEVLFAACGMEAAEIERLTEWYRQLDGYHFVCVMVTEGSGSNRVVPTGITVDSRGLLTFSVLETIPSVGTCDVAYHCLIAAVPGYLSFDRVETEITTVHEQPDE